MSGVAEAMGLTVPHLALTGYDIQIICLCVMVVCVIAGLARFRSDPGRKKRLARFATRYGFIPLFGDDHEVLKRFPDLLRIRDAEPRDAWRGEQAGHSVWMFEMGEEGLGSNGTANAVIVEPTSALQPFQHKCGEAVSDPGLATALATGPDLPVEVVGNAVLVWCEDPLAPKGYLQVMRMAIEIAKAAPRAQ